MVNFPGRDRRRRVLKDEVLAASSNHANLRAADDDASNDAPRYSDAAGVENHPQVTDFVPRKYRTIAMLVATGVGLTTALAVLQYFASPIGSVACLRSTAAIEILAPGSLASWLSAVVMLAASALCMLTYSIRRHRINDFRGRYRVWLGASIACLAMSADSVTGLHELASDLLTHLTGWSALRAGAGWWIAVAGLPVGWIAVRALFDMRECRLAGALFAAAMVNYAVSAATFLGLAPIADVQVQLVVMGASLLLGNWLVLASVISYARFVVLDAQGLITLRRPVAVKRTEKAQSAKAAASTETTTSTKSKPNVLSATGYSRSTIQTAKTPADSSRWLDGSRPERKRYDENDDEDNETSGDDRKISKSDRKRLRKLKTEGRAA